MENKNIEETNKKEHDTSEVNNNTDDSTKTCEESNTEELSDCNKEQSAEEENKVNYREIIAAMGDEELEDLFKKAEESSSYLDALQRSKADYENYRKRQERDRLSFLKYANQDILRNLLNLMDNLKRALETGEKADVDSSFFEGISIVHKEFDKILQDYDVKIIDCKGKPFNPTYHEALSQIENDQHPEMTVIEEFDKGYLYHDRVLRPSKVVVSRKPQVQNEEPKEL